MRRRHCQRKCPTEPSLLTDCPAVAELWSADMTALRTISPDIQTNVGSTCSHQPGGRQQATVVTAG